MPDAVAEGKAAAAAAVAAGRAAAALGTAQARLVYQMTSQVLNGETPLIVPLIGLSVAGITAGYVAYTETQIAAVAAQTAVQVEAAAADAVVQNLAAKYARTVSQRRGG